MNILEIKKLLFVIAMVFAGSVSANDEAKIISEIIEITNKYNKAWETVDMEKVSRYHAEDFKYYWHGTLTASSNKEFITEYKKIMATTKEWSMKVENLDVQVLSANSVVIGFNSVSSRLITTDNKEFEYGVGAFTYVWKKIDDIWKLAHIHESALEKKSNN